MKIAYLAVLACLLFSCKSKKLDTQYSSYETVGSSKLSIVIDDKNVDSTQFNNGVVDNTFYMELMTAKDTFFIKPINSELSFPKLHDNLTRVVIYYDDFKLEAQDAILTDRKDCFYFPNSNATLYLDYYPFTAKRTKNWDNISKDKIFFEIKNNTNGSYIYGAMKKHIPNHK